MSQITESKSKFLATKRICNAVSKEWADNYIKMTGKEPVLKGSDHGMEIEGLRKKIEALCETFSITPFPQTVQSAMRNPNGEWIPFAALSQAFEKGAPVLTNFIGELAGLFDVESGGEENKVKIKATLQSDTAKYSGSYFLGPDEIYAVHLETGEILKFRGRQVGGATTCDDGKMFVSFNVESEILLEDMVHEIVHAKWPEEIPQNKVRHESIDLISNEVVKRLHLSLAVPLSEIPSLREERSEIEKVFWSFDKALAEIIPAEDKRS